MTDAAPPLPPPSRRRPLARRFGASAALVQLHDVALAAGVMATVLAVRYRLEGKPLPDHLLSRSTLVFAATCAVVFPLWRLHRGLWRYTAVDDLVRLAGAVLTADVAVLPILFSVDRLADFPRSTPFVLAPVLFVVLAFGRALAQASATGDLGAALRLQDRRRPAAVLVAAPAAAAAYLRALRRRRDAPVRVCGLVTLDSPEGAAPPGRTVRGVEVLGPLPRLEPILKALAAVDGTPPRVVLAEPRPGRALMEAVVAAAAGAGAQVSRLRDTGMSGDLAPVQAADLLARPPRRLDPDAPRALISGRRVLVTGAGGSIGSELTRQALRLHPAALTLVDASEFNLYALDGELAASGAPPVWTAELGDVRDRARMTEIFARARPEVVLHAAALKHVPLMELNPTEAVRTNLGGAVVVAELAAAHAGALVFISTDKAVNPTNVMGATKRAAEQAVQAIARGGPCRACAVRFGNVLGSTGSVAPLFERQIAAGGPVTVTHPDMVRYFMTVQEASSLVLQAAALPRAEGEGGVYVLDMGEPVRIDDLARQMIRLHGLVPDTDIAVVHTGLRPGEKLYEEIFYAAETVRPTAADGVLAAVDPAPDWAELEPAVRALLACAEAQDGPETLRRLQALVPQFTRG